ncbi:MAG: sulfur carrier protein ThiS [Candidatus Omnitrophica bacterium]|nr:sulfur carrier protein ThiS [Candidatus Omnitrophota bacterium]
MKIRVNGENREVEDTIQLSAFLEQLGFNRQGIAVELNHEVVSRERWQGIALQPEDKLEIVQFVGGGSYGGSH